MSIASPPLRFAINDEVLKDLAEVIDHIDRLEEVIDTARKLQPAASPLALEARVASATGIPRSSLNRIINFLSNMTTTAERMGVDVGVAVEAISEAIEADATVAWKDAYQGRWKAIEEELPQLLKKLEEDHPLTISSKAARLTFTHQNMMTFAEIITDLRPVFNTAGDKILEGVVTHKLVITYRHGHEIKTIHLAMDADDIEKLSTSCTRATTKAETIRSSLGALWPITIIPGDDDE